MKRELKDVYRELVGQQPLELVRDLLGERPWRSFTLLEKIFAATVVGAPFVVIVSALWFWAEVVPMQLALFIGAVSSVAGLATWLAKRWGLRQRVVCSVVVIVAPFLFGFPFFEVVAGESSYWMAVGGLFLTLLVSLMVGLIWSLLVR